MKSLCAHLRPPAKPWRHGLSVAAAALPADRTAGASGDWHDLTYLPGGDVALVVGDAAGRGAQAQPLKDALQHRFRQVARTSAQPDHLVAQVERVAALEWDGYATAICAVVDPSGGNLVVANAGHPPPLVVTQKCSARFLTGSAEPPIGAPRPTTPPVLGRARLDPGDTLILYTDGLVEDRHRHIDEGFACLAATALRFAGAPVEEFCIRLLGIGLGGTGPADDLTVIALRLGNRSADCRWSAV